MRTSCCYWFTRAKQDVTYLLTLPYIYYIYYFKNKSLTATYIESKDGEPAAFPFSFQFLYWEDVGIIDVELIRNLLICGAVVICVIAAMIPVFRIAFFVILAVIFSVVDLVGFLGWWGTTVNGVSTSTFSSQSDLLWIIQPISLIFLLLIKEINHNFYD